MGGDEFMSITAFVFFPLVEAGKLLLAGIATVAVHASTTLVMQPCHRFCRKHSKAECGTQAYRWPISSGPYLAAVSRR